MTCNVFGVRVTASFGFFAVLAALLSVEQGAFFLPALLAVGLHEAGHIFAARFCGMEIESVHCGALGVRMEGNAALLGFGRRAAVSLGGPGMNLLCFPVFWMLSPAWGAPHLLLFAFHMLPALPLDGGAALYCLLMAHITPRRASLWMTILSAGVAFLIGTLGFYILLSSRYNFSMLLLAVYILFYAVFRSRADFS